MIIAVVTAIPFVGTGLGFLVLILGLGSVVTHVHGRIRPRRRA